jgi:lauroyl/myristoyl acyltransferase
VSVLKPFRYRLEELGCRGLAAIIPRLPRSACVWLGNALGAIAFALDGRGRPVSLANLECVFGSRYTPEERRAIARKSYQNFARTMLDLFWAAQLSDANWRKWMIPEGFEELRETLAREKRGTIFMCVHQGNWEWASLACGFLGFANVVVAETFKNPRLTEIFRARRQHSGQTLIDQENSLLRMLRLVKRGGATGMLIDLNLRPTQAATVIEAFGPNGLKMCVPLLHAVLAERAGALLVPVETRPQPNGTCRIIAHPPVAIDADGGISTIAQRCWDAFEPIIRERPEDYLWTYKHFRYRPKASPPDRYPFYSNESGKFEKLLRSQNITAPSTRHRPRASNP